MHSVDLVNSWQGMQRYTSGIYHNITLKNTFQDGTPNTEKCKDTDNDVKIQERVTLWDSATYDVISNTYLSRIISDNLVDYLGTDNHL